MFFMYIYHNRSYKLWSPVIVSIAYCCAGCDGAIHCCKSGVCLWDMFHSLPGYVSESFATIFVCLSSCLVYTKLQIEELECMVIILVVRAAGASASCTCCACGFHV